MASIQQSINSQGTIFQILLCALVFAYAYNIFSNLFHLFQIWKGIYKLNSFIKAYNQKRNVKRKQQALLRYFPIISKHLGHPSEALEYEDEPYSVHSKSIRMRNIMLSKRDFQFHRLRGSFNPASALKVIFMLPSEFLLWCGFRPSRIHKTTANIIGIFCEVLLAKALEAHYSELESFVKSILDFILGIWSNIP